MRLLCALLCFTLLTLHVCSAQTNAHQLLRFSPAEVKEDFQYLYKTLEQTHYNLYANTRKNIFENEYKRIYNSINDSLSLLQITRLFQPFTALSKLGHCHIAFPFTIYFDAQNQDTAKIFPFLTTMVNNHAFITANYSDDLSIQEGDEILSIDGVPMEIKLQEMYAFLSGEGDDIKNTLIDMFSFPRVYWWLHDSHDNYIVIIKRKQGGIKSIIAHGIKAADFEQRVSKRKSVFNLNRELKFIDDVSYLHPGIFINNQSAGNTSEHKTFDTNEFISFIDSAFREIHQHGSKNLIIDLRGNPGGDNAFSDPMIAYFAAKPFKFCSTFNVKTSSITKEFWKDVKDPSLQDLKNQILTRKNGDTFSISFANYLPRTDSLHFGGHVYALVDKYSYSNTVFVAAIIQDYRFGIVIGQPTADVASSYGATHEFKLPHSQLNVSYPKAFIVRPNGDKALKGVTPDFKAQDDIYTEKDEILDFTINYIKQRK